MRLIRPLSLVRVCTVTLGLVLSLPGLVSGAPQAAKPAAPPAKKPAASAPAPAKKTTYSASSSAARRARLARARAAARAREQARLRMLPEAMTPRFKTDATGATGAGRPRRRRDHLQPRDGSGALGGECAGQALDRQHHQGDDRGGVPRGQSRT